MPRLLLLLAGLLTLGLALPVVPLAAQDGSASADSGDASASPVAGPVRLQLVLPDSPVAPPAAQQRMLAAVAKRLIEEPSAALDAELAPGGRLLSVDVLANPFADRGMPTLPETALQNLAARILLVWMNELDAVAAADARQRTAAKRAAISQELAETKQRSLAITARLDALTGQRDGAAAEHGAMLTELIAAARRERLDAQSRLAELQVLLQIELAPVPIRPEIVRETGHGQLIHDAIERLRAAAEGDGN